ncbi:CotO family spore coat protein [Ornithinibacillus salinisoli]|uniref:CotO family spore coat protein n=1 Tax=Ornithinibacillus salinisoli TaxID=1848459 RepID=A0ABW4W229_9BACI
MGKKKYANAPLMYIDQPTLKRSGAKMQSQYSTYNKNAEAATQEQDVKKRLTKPIPKRSIGNKFIEQLSDKKPKPTKNTITENKNEELEEFLSEQEEDEQGEKPKFKDMSIKEKIEYFAETPRHTPKKRCEIKTDERSHRGIVVKFSEDIVLMRSGRRNVSIPLEHIKDVRMLGF